MVEMDGFHQEMWFVMLESAKDRILGVDTQDNMCHHVFGMDNMRRMSEWHIHNTATGQVKLTRALIQNLDEAVKEVKLLGEHEE
jgi:hypothetical protein